MCHGEYKSLLMDWWRWLKHKKGLEVATSSSLTPLAPWSCWALFLGEFVDDSVLDLMIFPILIFFQKKKWTKDVARNDHDIYIYIWYIMINYGYFMLFLTIGGVPVHDHFSLDDLLRSLKALVSWWLGVRTVRCGSPWTRSMEQRCWKQDLQKFVHGTKSFKNIQIHTHSTWNPNKWSLEYDFRLSVAILGCSGLFWWACNMYCIYTDLICIDIP